MEDSQGLRGSVTSYVEQEDTREAIDIAAVNNRKALENLEPLESLEPLENLEKKLKNKKNYGKQKRTKRQPGP